MTKYLILITILVLLYLYWKAQQNQSLPKDEIIEHKGKSKETFWDAEDFDLNSDDSEEENQAVNQEPNQWQTERQELTKQLANLQTMLQPLNINNLTKKDLSQIKDLVAEINNQWLSK